MHTPEPDAVRCGSSTTVLGAAADKAALASVGFRVRQVVSCHDVCPAPGGKIAYRVL
jgi:hypothetical protein